MPNIATKMKIINKDDDYIKRTDKLVTVIFPEKRQLPCFSMLGFGNMHVDGPYIIIPFNSDMWA